jgi:hypothetical protein
VKGVIRSSVTTAVEAVTLSLAAADLTGLTRATSCRSSGDFMGRIRLVRTERPWDDLLDLGAMRWAGSCRQRDVHALLVADLDIGGGEVDLHPAPAVVDRVAAGPGVFRPESADRRCCPAGEMAIGVL